MVKKNTATQKDFEKLPIVGNQPRSEKEDKFLREVCEFEFYNLEDTGLSIKFPYGSTNVKEEFMFFHGGKYKLPRHIARHVESRTTPRYEWQSDGTGKMVSKHIGEKPRFQMRQIFA